MTIAKKAIVGAIAVLSSLVVIVAALAAVDTIAVPVEKRRNLAPGKMVEVQGQNMHVYSEGSGEKKVILWSGLGTPCPVIDFKPLIKELSSDYTVIVVENFGYGWSDWTDRERSSRNIVEETREALAKAGFPPPYSILAHSISGSYALYYSIAYPREISAIICEDTDVPKINAYVDPIKPSYGINALRKLGLVRTVTWVFPSLAGLPKPGTGNYTKEDYKLLRTMACWNAWNKSVIRESEMEKANIDEFSDRKFSKAIPVKMVVSREITDFVDKARWGIDWVSLHRMALEDDSPDNVIVVEGGHYIHRENSALLKRLLDSMTVSIE